MTPHKLTLKNFHGIKAGTGLDEITLDIDALAGDDAQLVLLKGDNGSGKTTLLDNMHPYRLMPSRASGYSPGSFSYFDHTYGDAGKVLEWSHNGTRYRSQLLIKGSGKAKKTEAYLQRRDGLDEWLPATLPDGVTSDGKTSTYDACVEHILGTPEMFFTAAFSSQNRRQLSSYSNADIKGLMAELLALGDITDLGEKSATVVKLLTARVNGIRQELSMYTMKRDTRSGMARDKAAAEVEQEDNHKALVAAQDAYNTAAAHLKETERLSVEAEEARSKREKLLADQEQIRSAAATRAREIDVDIDAEMQRRDGAVTRYARDAADIQSRITTAGGRIESNSKLLERKEEIEQACIQVDVLQEKLIKAEQAGRDARVKADKLKEITERGRALQAEYDAATLRINAETQALEQLVRASSLVDDVPCNGTDLQPKCMLLKDAVTAKQAIPEKTQSIDLMTAGQAIRLKRQEDIAVEAMPYRDADQAVQGAIDLYRETQAELGNVKAVAALKPALDAAGIERDRAVKERDDLTAGLQETEQERDRLLADIDARLTELAARKKTVEAGAAQEVSAIQEQLDRIPAGDTSIIERVRSDHQVAKQRLDTLNDAATTLSAKVAAYNERIAVLDQELAGATALTNECERLNTEIGHWQLLTKALGRDGIVALCIDDAGPTLATLTNDLLLSCYGPRFTVSIETQAETASGSTRETFDIRVFDGDRDEDKSVSDMSGGERIYINEAMTRAIALYQAQQSGQQYGTLFSDESDGALDPKRKVMFTSMKRKVLELGGYQREIFITHTPELWDLADAVIDIDAMKAAA